MNPPVVAVSFILAATRVAAQHKKRMFSNSAKDALILRLHLGAEGAKDMSKVSFALLIVLGLTLTSYFGLAAWRASGEDQTEILGTVAQRTK